MTYFWIPSARSNSVTLEAKAKVVCSEITTTLDSLEAEFIGFQLSYDDTRAPALVEKLSLPLSREGMGEHEGPAAWL